MSFTDELQKKLLPSAEVFMKAVERDYQEPVKQLLAIEREIRTLRNPTNLARASRASGAGSWTQLLSSYEKLQRDSREDRTKAKKEALKYLDTYTTNRNNAMEPISTTDAVSRIGGLAEDLNKNPNKKSLELRLPTTFGEKEDSTTTVTHIFALSELKKALYEQSTNKKYDNLTREEKSQIDWKGLPNVSDALIDDIDVLCAEYLQRPNVEASQIMGKSKLSKLTRFDPIKYTERVYPDVSDDRVKNQIVNNPAKYPNLLKPSNIDFSTVADYTDKIAWVEQVVRGQIPIAAPPADADIQLKSKFVNDLPVKVVLEPETQQIVVDTEASEVEQKIAAEFLKDQVGSTSPKYADLINSKAVREAVSGTASGTSSKLAMIRRAEELEERKQGLIEQAVDAGRLTPAQLAVMSNPLMPATGFRRTSRSGVLSGSREMPEATSVEPEEVEEVDDSFPETTGVPIIPAIINRVTKAYERATTADVNEQEQAHIELTNVIEDFKRLPEEIQGRFPSTFLTGIYEFSQPREGKSSSPEAQQQQFEKAVRSLADTGITTETVSQYVATTDSAEDTVELLSFLKHPDSTADGSSIGGRRNPLGSIGFDFFDTMNSIAENKASSSDLMDVFSRAKSFNRSNSPESFEISTLTNKYGQYDSIDRFVKGMDAGRGERVAPPSTPKVDDPESPDNPFPEGSRPFPEGSRKAREWDRMTQERIDKAANEAFAESMLQEDDDPDNLITDRDDSEVTRQAIATASRPVGTSFKSPREVQLAAAAEKVAQEEDPEAILAAQDAELKARSERPTVTGTDDTIADRVLRESMAPAPAPTVDRPLPDDQEILSDEDKRAMDIAAHDARPGQAPHGTVFPASAGSTVTPIETIAPEGESVAYEEMPPAQRQKIDTAIAKADVEAEAKTKTPAPAVVESADVSPEEESKILAASKLTPEQIERDREEASRQNKEKQDQATVWRAVFSGVQSGELPPERAYSLVDEYANKFVTQPDKVQKIRKRIGEMTGEPYEDFVLKSETQIAATPSASGSR